MSEWDPYRRGLTLGLTMAEVFILILFLLLLITLFFYHEYEEVEREREEARAALTEITVMYEERAELPKEIQRLRLRNTELESNIAGYDEDNTLLQKLLEESEQSREAAQAALAREREGMPEDLRELTEQVDALQRELASTKEENIRLVSSLYDSKGVDPPCWYKVVSRQGKRHEKPYYLLDAAVHDEYLRVRINHSQPLPGRAIDVNERPAATSYAQEYERLPLAALAGGERQLSLAEFRAFARPINRMGKNEQIRDYACVFYARIWDHTSTTAKARWQRAREEIEHFFYPLLIRNDPW